MRGSAARANSSFSRFCVGSLWRRSCYWKTAGRMKKVEGKHRSRVKNNMSYDIRKAFCLFLGPGGT